MYIWGENEHFPFIILLFKMTRMEMPHHYDEIHEKVWHGLNVANNWVLANSTENISLELIGRDDRIHTHHIRDDEWNADK